MLIERTISTTLGRTKFKDEPPSNRLESGGLVD